LKKQIVDEALSSDQALLEMLENGIKRYNNGLLTTAEIIQFLVDEVAEKVKANATIDWTIRESARAKLMVMVKRTLNKYGYPPDMQQKAIDTVLRKAELLADYFVRSEA